MSLISTQNFLAPFRSKFQIGSILVLAALVGMIRFASHSESVSKGETMRPSASSPAAAGDDITRFLESRGHSQRRAPSGDDEAIENLFDGEAESAGTRAAPLPPSRPAQEPEKLNDIKRSLGLE